MPVFVRSLATSNPSLYVTQSEAFDFYMAHFPLSVGEKGLYRRLMLGGAIRGRYVGMDRREDSLETDPDILNARFIKYARQTAADAARKALLRAGGTADQVAGVAVNTCTGYACPGLSSYLAEDLGLPHWVKALDIAGMGCGGALPNLECAAGLARSVGEGLVLSVAVEICSATLFMGADPGLVVSNSIFGDGASAAVLTRGADGSWFRILDFETGIFPAYREHLRYRCEGGRLRNVLHRQVPAIGVECSQKVLGRLLERNNLSVADVPWWALHAGGTEVLRTAGASLGLAEAKLRYSLDVFRNFGNMSSPSVMFALKNVIEQGRPQEGDKGVLLAFGAGFSAFGCLIEFGRMGGEGVP